MRIFGSLRCSLRKLTSELKNRTLAASYGSMAYRFACGLWFKSKKKSPFIDKNDNIL
jgi:hypothetical protein